MFRMFADIDFTDDIQLILDWRTNLLFRTIGNTNHIGNLDFSARVTSILFLDTSFLFLRTEQPSPRSGSNANAFTFAEAETASDHMVTIGGWSRRGFLGCTGAHRELRQEYFSL